MNLDSLSFSLSQISYLVANLTKKNFKQNNTELSSLVERHGAEAERHLFRCLFSWIDFGGDGKSTGKDYHQIQLLIQEFLSLLTRPTYITTTCHSIENPFSHQKSLHPTSNLITNISRVLHFTKVQEIALAISLQHSTQKELQKIATDFIKEKFPILLQLCTSSNSEGRKAAENEIGLQDIPVEVLHLLLTYLASSTLVESNHKQNFINLLRKDFPSDRCPLALLPFLFEKEEDIHFEKLLADSSVSTIMSSSNSGAQKHSANMSLADFIRESGFNSCSSVEECRKLLQAYKVRNINASTVAKVLTMMARTTTSNLDSVPLLQSLASGNGWGDKDKNDDQQPGWNVDNFIQVAKELNNSLNARDVLMEFDFPGFVIEDAAGFKLLVRALRLLVAGQHESFPIDPIFRTWNNTKGQISWLQQCIRNPHIFPIGESISRPVNLEVLKQPVDDESSTGIWKSLDLHDCLLRLSEFGLYKDIRALYDWPYSHCPDLLALALVQVGVTTRSLHHDLICSLIPVFLGSHPNAAIVLNYMWNAQSQPNSVLRQLIIRSIAEWYTSYDQYDQQKLSRILDIAQDLKALPFLLSSTPFSFVIDLAVLASRREYLKLDKWLSDKMLEHREEFIQACVSFLKRRCPSILVRPILKEELSQTINLPVETLTTLLYCLRTWIGNVSEEVADQIVTMLTNCNTVINKSRPPPTGVMNKPPAPQTVPPAQQSVIPTPPTLPAAPSSIENMLSKPMDPVLGSSGFGGNKSILPGQNSGSAFGQSSDFVGQAPTNNRMPSAIGSNNTGGSNISSPAGAGILPPHSGVSDAVGMASMLGSTASGGVGPIGGSANPGSQFLGGNGGFSSSIAQSLTSQLGGTGNNNSFGLGGGQTSTAGRFGASQSGFSTDSLSQGFSSNPFFSNIGNVGGLPSGSDGFSSSKLDLLSGQKQDSFRNRMQDLFPQPKTGLGNTNSMGMGGSGFGASFGGGISSSGLEMFGQKKPPTSGMLNPAAQQAFQQAATKPNKPPISDFSQVSPEMNQQFSKEIEDEANGYFQRIYNQPPHPTLTVDAILELLQNFKDSNNTKEKEVFNCMMRNLFEEYRFFPQYPDKELHITACLFGGIIEKNLVTYIPLGIALRYVLDALRKPTNNKMYFLFGIAALDRFKNKLKDYPQYCGHITAIAHFKEFPPPLIEAVENGRRSDDPLNPPLGGSTDALGLAGPQMNTLPPVGDGSNMGRTSGATSTNPHPGRSTSAGPKISLPTTVGKEIQQPSIAKATNIDTLLEAKFPEEKIPEPPEAVQDKIAFIFNNLSVSNMTPKSNEMKDIIKEEYFRWLAQYLVMKRVSIEPNFHLLYSNFLDCLKMPGLNKRVRKEVYRNITVLLQSDKVAANFSDRSLLKNLGHFLGIISLAKNQPILYDDIALKSLLYEAYTKGAQELLYVVPFVAKVLESVGKSRVFKLPNPWTEALMSVLKELHMEPDLKLNLKFEVEVLCKNLQIDINDIKPAHYLRDPQLKFSIECQLSTSKKELTIKTSTPSEPTVRTTTPMLMGMTGLGLGNNFPPPSVPPPPPAPPQPQQQQPQQQQQPPPIPLNSFTPRFSFHDINLYALSTLQSHLTVKSDIPLLQSQPQLKPLVRPAVERSIQELIQMASERAIKITLQTCEQVIRKDFALDPEEHRMKTAAQNMVRNLTAGMALITCREQLLQSLQNYLKQTFMQALGRTPQALTPQQKELIEQAASVIAADNVELGCCFIQKNAVERALVDMDKRMHNDYEFRKQARQEGRRYCDPAVLTYQAERMPEQIRLKVGSVSPQQIVVYDEFSRNIPGFLPSNDATQPSGFLSKPMQNWAVDEITQVYDRCIAEFDQYMQSFQAKQGTPQYSQLLSLRDALHLARNSREASVAVALLQKAVEGLLDPTNQPGSETEVFPAPVLARYRDCHFLVLKTLQDQRAYGPQWTNKNVTQCLINHSDDYKYNIDLVEKLIRSNFINMQLYDQHLAQALENGMNYMALRFAMQLIRLFLVDDRQGAVNEADFAHTIEVLTKISRGQAPEGLPQLLELLRSNYDSALDKLPGLSHMLQSGISQAREYDDPQGLHEKTEFLLREWVNIYHSPTSGRDSTRGFATFVHQMHQHGILRTDDLITRFFRLSTEMCVDLSYRLLQESNVSPSLVNPTLVRAKCFHTLDAFVRLITLLVKHSGDAVNSITKINLLNKVLGIVVGVLLHDHETRQMDYHQMPYHRIFIMLFYELNAPEHVLESINFQTLTAFTNTYHILRPSKAPGFAFAWLELISYRSFISRMLLHTPHQKGWSFYAQLLVDLFKFLAPFLRNVELTKSVQILYKGTLRLLLVLLHDFPEFLCDYHYNFCDVIPANCIQLRNLILSAFPRNMRLPDPFTPNLKVDMLQEINNAPRILANIVSVMPPQFLNDLDSYLNTRAPVTFLTELRTNLQRSNEAGTKYNICLINSLVMHVGTKAIQYIQSKGGAPSMASITHSSHMDIFQNLAVDLDTEGRYLFLNAIANQLRYPNSHTHYFSCTLLYLFAETNQESIQEQITRVLLERLIVNRPHPWGLLITFIELIKNPNFKFWSHEFVHCTPEISKLFESVARSCMGKQFNQQGGADAPSSTSPVSVASAVPSS